MISSVSKFEHEFSQAMIVIIIGDEMSLLKVSDEFTNDSTSDSVITFTLDNNNRLYKVNSLKYLIIFYILLLIFSKMKTTLIFY